MESRDSGRRLAAILFTDIVGYTSLMQEDEVSAIASVKKHQRILEELVPAHHGEIYQYYGDGSLCIFNSALDAVRCAYALQKQMLEDPFVPLRTGIHIGEIHFDEGKIFGDGVNLASRIESIGQPGTVFFSRHVYEKVRNHKDLLTSSIGVFHFKNVDVPMEVFALVNPDIRVPDKKRIEGKLRKTTRRAVAPYVVGLLVVCMIVFMTIKWIPGIVGHQDITWQGAKSVAVLPFENISGVEEDEYLSVGIAEDILTQLSKVGDMKVISRESSSRYKGSDKPRKTIAKELGVATLLQGSVQSYGNKVRISVQLIDPENDSYIWAENFDKDFDDILNLQREVAQAVSSALRINLTPVVQGQFQQRTSVKPSATIKYYRAQEMMKQSIGSPEQLQNTIDLFREATEEDPSYALAWIGLAESQLEFLFWGRAKTSDIIPKARKAVDMALSLDPEMGEGYCILGTIAMFEFKMKDAERLMRRAVELSPNYAPAQERLGMILTYMGDEHELIERINKAMELDPLSTKYVSTLAFAYFNSRQIDDGILALQKYLDLFPDDDYLLWNLGYLYFGKGDYDKAIETFRKRKIHGAEMNWMLGVTYAMNGQTDKTREILQYQLEKKKNEYVPDYIIAVLYTVQGDYDTGLDYLESCIANGNDANFLWGLPLDPAWDAVRDNPRFQKALQFVTGEDE